MKSPLRRLLASFPLASLVPLCSGAGCNTEQTLVKPNPSWERMLDQPRYDSYEPSTFFRDGRVMQTPPAGTVPRGAIVGPTPVVEGTENGRDVTKIPVSVTRALLARGRDGFETVCANCHGVLGDGNTPVAMNMQLRKAPSLHERDTREYPPGRIFRVITEGYGLMASHKAYLTPGDRWAIVAYLRALQLSRYAPVALLPAAIQQELLREAP